MVGMILPQAVYLSDKKALHQHQQHTHADFEKIVIQDKELIRYFSDEPCFCVGEWLKTQFNDESFVYIENLDFKTAYAVFINEGRVIKEYCGDIDDTFSLFAYFTKQVSFYVSSDEILASKWQTQYPQYAERVQVINPIGVLNVNAEFKLNSLNEKDGIDGRKKQLMGAALAILLGIGGIGIYKVLNPPPPPPPPNPVEIWRESLFTKTPASPALSELATLLSYLYLMPTEWQIDSTSVSSNTATITVTPRTPQAMESTLDQYLMHYPEVGKLFDKSSRTLTLALKSKPPELWFKLGNFPQQLNDMLLLIGADSVEKTELPTLGDLEQIQYHFTFTDVPYAMLKNLSEIFENKPLSIDNLSITQGSFFSFISIDMTITLEGLPSGT
ncbi:hypothetical protein [Photobacterium damselae]|uniref:hypothetical protein n=1 Tax=Photobacterium damselae TaxID=38293 RepID=UPI000A2FA917|nr:hypothetical protein [Photobacterium damselae]ARR51790.1 hypothetical protein CAY62_20455 [Photobacterium damselae subsp. damselae]